MSIIELCESMNLSSRSAKWLRHYEHLCSRAKKRELSGQYFEKHHIIPICIGGKDSPENLVKLLGREHYVAHLLLAQIFPKNRKLLSAIIRMSRKADKLSEHHPLSKNKLFDWVRRSHAEVLRGRNKDNDAGLKRSSEKQKGRNKYNYEPMKKVSEKFIGRTKENHEGIARAANKKRGRSKENHEGTARQAEALTGRTKEEFEYLQQHSLKMKGRTKDTHDGPKKISAALAGRTKNEYDYIKKHSAQLKKLTPEQEAELFSLKIQHKSHKEIVNHFDIQGIQLAYSTISTIYQRLKRDNKF